MSEQKLIAFRVGRSKECDVVIADPTVSRHHAEFVVNSANDLVLVDCESKFGTFVRTATEWRRITTSRVNPDDRIRLGHYETSIKAIIAAVAERLPSPAAYRPAAAPPSAARPTAAAAMPAKQGKTIVERDPETGEIVTRKDG
jgi:predicted component of type VI protein secretion system